MRCGFTFSGIGGFELAAQCMGWELVWSNEINPWCCQVLRKNFNHDIIERDIREIGPDNLPPVDIICGGFPCKQTSVGAAIHGKRKGLDGKDSGLWWEYLRLMRLFRPLWGVAENTGGVKKWDNTIQDSLERIGYRVSRLYFEASDFGYPHKRGRYIYVANSNGQRLEVTRRKKSPETSWVERLATDGGSWISTTPGVVGMFNGLPHRVDRIEGLGNALMPEKAYEIFKTIEDLTP